MLLLEIYLSILCLYAEKYHFQQMSQFELKKIPLKIMTKYFHLYFLNAILYHFQQTIFVLECN